MTIVRKIKVYFSVFLCMYTVVYATTIIVYTIVWPISDEYGKICIIGLLAYTIVIDQTYHNENNDYSKYAEKEDEKCMWFSQGMGVSRLYVRNVVIPLEVFWQMQWFYELFIHETSRPFRWRRHLVAKPTTPWAAAHLQPAVPWHHKTTTLLTFTRSIMRNWDLFMK